MIKISRGKEDNRCFIYAFQKSFVSLTEKGFSFSYTLPENNEGMLLIQFVGPFQIEIERDKWLVTAIYLFPLNVNKPPSIKRVGIERLIFITSQCKENISGIMPRFWYPDMYLNDAEFVSDKIAEYYEQIEWLMRNENSSILYDMLKKTGKDFMRTIM